MVKPHNVFFYNKASVKLFGEEKKKQYLKDIWNKKNARDSVDEKNSHRTHQLLLG